MSICGYGIDLVDLRRIQKAYEKQAKMADRILNPAEKQYCAFDKAGWPGRLGACFAVKEAASKALGCGIGEVGWKDIELSHAPSGAPVLVLHGEALERFRSLGAKKAHLSLSHEKEMAVAGVLLET